MPEAVIVGGVRTPFARAAAEFNDIPAQDLGRLVVRELLDRFDLDPAEVDELITGNVASPIDAANVSRVIALRAGIPRDRIAHTVNRNCASGMEAVTEAVDRIESGAANCIVAAGVDSMSNIPVYLGKRFTNKMLPLTRAKSALDRLKVMGSFRPGDLKPIIGVKVGLTDPVSGLMMGETAEKLAREFAISRERQDEFALRSHQKAIAALESGRLADETMAVYAGTGAMPITRDTGPRSDQSLEKLAKLRPYFDPRWGTVTVGNSCGVTDGAVALLIMSAEKARALGYQPLGRVRGYAYAGCDPSRMGLGPVFATARAMHSANMRLDEMELIELNEAFAAQVLACLEGFRNPEHICSAEEGASRLSPIDEEKLNVNGGAIALGHPVGATGARLVLTLLNELARRDQTIGLATLCVGGGQGAAVVVERLGMAA